ncbi:MAG: hypothetical protein ACREIV_13100, partial [Planctomycetaceae bacterium]
DRSFSAVGLSDFGFPGSFFAGATDAGGAFVSLGTFADPRCPAALGGPEFPDSQFQQNPDAAGNPATSICKFNYAATAATEADIDRDSFFINGNYQVTENTGFFARGTFSKLDSFGRFAPTPFSSQLVTISADNPNNPTAPGAVARNPLENSARLIGADYSQIDVDGDGVADFTGPFDLTLLYRNIPGGFRDGIVEDILVDFVAGFNGTVDLMGGMDWEIAAQHSTGISDQTSTGLGFAGTLDDRIDAADGLTLAEAMAQLAADPTLIYDVFGLAGDSNFESIVPSAVHTGLADYEHRVASVDGQVSFDLLQMPSGPLAAAVGFEYRDEKFLQDFDAQQNAANVAGSAGAADVSGARVAKSLFAELAIPVVDIVEVSLAGRYDDYNDFGT